MQRNGVRERERERRVTREKAKGDERKKRRNSTVLHAAGSRQHAAWSTIALVVGSIQHHCVRLPSKKNRTNRDCTNRDCTQHAGAFENTGAAENTGALENTLFREQSCLSKDAYWILKTVLFRGLGPFED